MSIFVIYSLYKGDIKSRCVSKNTTKDPSYWDKLANAQYDPALTSTTYDVIYLLLKLKKINIRRHAKKISPSLYIFYYYIIMFIMGTLFIHKTK